LILPEPVSVKRFFALAFVLSLGIAVVNLIFQQNI
jgi:hypothetical protein